MTKSKGEGDHEAGRRYQREVKQSVEEGDLDEGAEAAKRAMEDPEGQRELDEAARKAKKGPPTK